jgi:hypothetical protein
MMAVKRKGSKYSGLPLKEKEILEGLEKEGIEVDDLLEESETELQLAPSPKPTTPKTKPKPTPLKTPLKKNKTKSLILRLLKRIEALEGERASKRTSSTTNVVRVPTPAMFTGKRGSFQFFASKVESYVNISNVSRDKWVAVALQCMEERPTKVWGTYLKRKEREGGQTEPTWEDFKNFMGNRYDSTDLVMAARQKLDHVYQGQESVERYIERFISLLSDVETEYDICENDKIYMFLKGLNAPIRVACTVNPQTGVRFTSLDSLCTYVVQYESNLKSGGMLRGQEGRKVLNVVKRTPTSTPAYFPGFTQGPVLGAVGHNVGGKLDSRTSVPSERQCYFCKNFGHEQWQCQAKRDYLQRKSRRDSQLPPPPPFPSNQARGGQWKGRGGRGAHWKGKGPGHNPQK